MAQNLPKSEVETDLEIEDSPLSHVHLFHIEEEQRVIYLIGEVNQDLFSNFVKNLNYLNNISSDPITIYFSSCGGEVHYGLAIYDAIALSPAPTIMIGYGELCSAATFILQAATVRLLMPSTSFLVHSIHLGVEDNIKEAKAHITNTEKYYDVILDIYAQKMKKKIEFVRKWIDDEREVYLFPKEVVKAKLADGIFSQGKFKSLESIKAELGVL